LLSNSYAFDLCILANLAFDGPNLAFLHRHNGLYPSFLDSLSCATSPHAAVVPREDSSSPRELFFPPRCRLLSSRHLFSFPARNFVDYWRVTELWRTATSWTGGPGGHDSQKRRWLATSSTGGDKRRKFPRRGKNSHEARQTKKDPGQK